MPDASRTRSLAWEKWKPHELVTTVTAGIIRHSRTRMVLTVSFVLFLVIGLFCHHRRRIISADLTPASRRQNHTTSPSASRTIRQRRQSVHRIPHPTFVTIGQTSLCSGRDGGKKCQ